jgi:hypothetical protein
MGSASVSTVTTHHPPGDSRRSLPSDKNPVTVSRRSSWMHGPVVVTGVRVLVIAVVELLVTVVTGSDSAVASWVSNLGQLAVAILAAATAAVTVTRHTGPQRRAWLLVALAATSWAVGQLIWCYFDIVRDGEIPQVSIADGIRQSHRDLLASINAHLPGSNGAVTSQLSRRRVSAGLDSDLRPALT